MSKQDKQDKSGKSISEHAAELEKRDLEATEASRKAAEAARAHVESAVREYLESSRANPDVEVDEADTAVHRLDEIMARAAARPGARDSGMVTAVGNENKDGPATLRPAADSAPRTERVIIVEDDAAIRLVLSELLREEGYSVRTAEDGLDALNKILKDRPPPDVILLDLGLPFLPGPGVIAALKHTAQAELANSVLIISASSPTDLPDELGNEFVFVKKPIDIGILLKAVRARIGEARAKPKLPF